MSENSNGPLAQEAPGRIRMIIASTLGVFVKDDPRINDKDLNPLLAEVSRILDRKVVLPSKKPKHGWKMTLARLTNYIYNNQALFEPLPPEQRENSNHETESPHTS